MIKFNAVVKQGGITTSRQSGRPKVSLIIEPGHGAEMAQMLTLMEMRVTSKVHVVGNKGTDIEFVASVWKVRTDYDGGVIFVFDLEEGHPEIAVFLTESAQVLENLVVEVENDETKPITYPIRGRSAWTPQKREYPN